MKRAIDVVMIVVLIITLFPIFWMVFCSFKSNTEILLGKIPFGRASNDVVAMQKAGKSLYAFTADGGINKFDANSAQLEKRSSAKTMATGFIMDDPDIWISSSDKGLIQYSMGDISKKRDFNFGIDGLDINKVVSTFMEQDQSRIWVGIQQKGLEKILVFDKASRSFAAPIQLDCSLSPFQMTTIFKEAGTLWIGTNKGLIHYDLSGGRIIRAYDYGALNMPVTDIKKIAGYNGGLLLATSSGLFEFSEANGAMVRSIDASKGLLSDRVNALFPYNGNIIAGMNDGLSVVSGDLKTVKNYDRLFLPIAGSKEKGKVQGDVFSILNDNGKLYLGSSGGRISLIDGGTGNVERSYLAGEGHLVVRWRNYVDLWKNIDFGLYLKNSLIICGMTMVIAMIFATLAAYALARFNFPGNNFFSIGVLATQMIPAIMYLIPIYIMFTKFTMFTGVPMKGTYFGLIMIYSAFFTPFSIWILRGFFAAIPVELEEAGRIDGCSSFQVFWYIVLPLAVPGIIATGIYVFLTAWDELMFAWVLCNADTMTIPVGIRLFVGNYQNRFDLMMAAATVATVPVMILFFMLQKYIVKGLTAGAVKG